MAHHEVGDVWALVDTLDWLTHRERELSQVRRRLHDRIAGTSGKLVNIVHDEIIVECDTADAEAAAETLRKAMCDAGEEFIRKVPVNVDVHIAEEWTK